MIGGLIKVFLSAVDSWGKQNAPSEVVPTFSGTDTGAVIIVEADGPSDFTQEIEDLYRRRLKKKSIEQVFFEDLEVYLSSLMSIFQIFQYRFFTKI